ncbi:MAG: L-seryl-tRNA(Sec) selenium transferase [Planctomycetes bacterium]|nr:L-seryl-tRNA(Sec) selenium transferase [Planctomycetota bacterium]
MSSKTDPRAEAFRLLPSVEEVLHDAALVEPAARVPRELWVGFVRDVLEAWRGEIKAGTLDATRLGHQLARGELAAALSERVERERRAGIVRVVNATGVVLHTGLGRAPVHVEAAEAMARAASSYCVLEVDRESGERNQRDERLSALLQRLTGAEAGIVVNNNAAAVYLLLNTFLERGRRDEVIVSRGELVEIGGSFRVPDVMERAGVVLREVGTTNRTRIEDYRSAIGERTALLMKVHTSNFRVQGFTEEVEPRALAELGARAKLPTAFDLGSGLLEGDGLEPLPASMREEPRVRDAVESGVDVVTFSGDKLLGGPQSGLLVGKRATITALRRNPVYRALRQDKATIAGLERTLELYLAGRGDEIPSRAMLRASAAEMETRARELASRLASVADCAIEVVAEQSQPGSGSAPGVFLPTFALRVTHARASAAQLALALRRGEPPVFARVQDGAVLLDPRTLLAGDAELLERALRAAVV